MAVNSKYQTWTLSNGLDVVFTPMPHTESVYIILTGKVGRRAEHDNETGAAHFLEHLFLDGTTKRPSAQEINRFIESVGGSRNGFTGPEEVGYHGKVVKNNAEYMFDFISDIFQHSLLEEFQKERDVIAQEAAQDQDDPMRSLMFQRITTMFPGQGIGQTIFEEEKNLPNMTPDVIQTYYRRTYTASNFALGIAGNIESKRARELAEKYFTSIEEGESLTFEPAQVQSKRTIDIETRDIGQSKLAISFAGPPLNHNMQTAVQVMRYALGMGSSSRLYNRLRHEMGIAYFTGVRLNVFSDTGIFTILTYVDETNLQKTCDTIVEEVQALLDKGISDQELERAKNMHLSDTVFNSEEPEYIANNYTRQHLLTGNVQDLQQKIDDIRSITKENVIEAARLVFSDQPKVNIITTSLKEVNIPDIRID